MEIAALCGAAVLMAALYTRTAHPKLYAFFNTAVGTLSLIASEMMFSGELSGLTFYNTALSVIFGVPGTIAHRLIGMI